MAHGTSASTLVEGSGDFRNKVEPVAPAAVQTDVPRSAGRWETMLYGVALAAALVYPALDFYFTFGWAPEQKFNSHLLKPGWLSDWMEDPLVSLESKILKHHKFLIAVSVGFLLVSHLTMRLAPRSLHYLATAGYTMAVTAVSVGIRPTVYMLLVHCGAVCMGYFSLAGVWLLVLSAMMLQNSEYSGKLFQLLRLRGSQSELYFPIIGYLFCRSISAGHSLNRMLRQQRQETEAADEAPSLLSFLRLHLPRALAYGFYLPWHFAGPILTFQEFCREAEKADRLAWDWRLLLLLLWRAARLLLWLLLLQVLHHFLPVGAFLHSIESYGSVPYSRLVFSMYLHGQNFMLAYVQLYGWPGLVARIDGLELPHWPDCISRVYTYRQMWRVFDRGLAGFMHSHIYIPMGGSRRGIFRQLAAVTASFAFVSIYHGDSHSVRIWAGLNALQLLLETMACAFYEARLKALLCMLLNPMNHQRLVAFTIGCNLFITSCFIFVFLMNSASALRLVVEIFKPLLLYRPWWHLLVALTLSYCSVQVSLRYESCVCKPKSEKNY